MALTIRFFVGIGIEISNQFIEDFVKVYEVSLHLNQKQANRVIR